MERMNSKETIVYGGAFNPPTLAHVAILGACFEYANQADADVWVLPSGNRLDKTIPTPRQKRLEYIGAMIQDADTMSLGATVLPLELDRTIPIETADTVRELQSNYPDRMFRFVFGADSTETMVQWKDGQKLLDTLPMLVVERPGSRINPLARFVVRLQVTTPDVSSTRVREQLSVGGSVSDLVSPSVSQLLV